MSTAAVPCPLAPSPSVLYHLGPRDTKASKQMAQRLRTDQNLPYYHASVKRVKAAQRPYQAVWQSRDTSLGPEPQIHQQKALDLLVAKNRIISVLPYAFRSGHVLVGILKVRRRS